MTVVEAHEVESMITLDTPWDELKLRPELEGMPESELEYMRVRYEKLRAAQPQAARGGFPWFPFIFTNQSDSELSA